MTFSLTQWLSHGFLAFSRGNAFAFFDFEDRVNPVQARPEAAAPKMEVNVRDASPSTSARTLRLMRADY